MITGKNHIGYNLSSEGNKTYKTFNPVTNTENDVVHYVATSQEIDTACKFAAEAFDIYKKTPGIKRAAFLIAIADEIMAFGDVLLATYCKESGLHRGRAENERARTVKQLKMFAKLIETEQWREPSSESENSNIRKILIPIGPVAVFGASNFPLAYSTAGGDTASALAAGNPVIVKSHPMHAETGEIVSIAITNAAHRTGMPEGIFSNLKSNGISVGEKLVLHPSIKAVGFTGSIRGGRALYNLAATRKEPIPVFAEMGSINPVVITQKSLETRSSEIANMYADSIATGAGQFCTNPGLILTIESKEASLFSKQLGAKLAKKPSFFMLHPEIQKEYARSRDEVKKQTGVSLVNESELSATPNMAQATLVTVHGATFLENSLLHQEVFGPFSIIVQCSDKGQLLQIIKTLEGQLTGTIIAEKSDYASLVSLIDALQDRVGRIIFNGVPTGVEVCEAMTHGGPYPASTDSRFTAVGESSIRRWVRPFSYQGVPVELLPQILS